MTPHEQDVLARQKINSGLNKLARLFHAPGHTCRGVGLAQSAVYPWRSPGLGQGDTATPDGLPSLSKACGLRD